MSDSETNTPKLRGLGKSADKGLTVNLGAATGFIALTVAIIGGLYVVFFKLHLGYGIGGPEAWGQFGDYFGGILNPLISAVALVVVELSVQHSARAVVQGEKMLEMTKDELSETRAQIENNNQWLLGQIETMRTNANLERLASQATLVSERLEQFSPPNRGQNPRPYSAPLIVSEAPNGRKNVNEADIWIFLDVQSCPAKISFT